LRVEKEGRDLRVGSRIPLGMSPTKFKVIEKQKTILPNVSQ
jgi:hypothetical protein